MKTRAKEEVLLQSAARKSLQLHVNTQKILRRNEERDNRAAEIQEIRTFGKEMRHEAKARVFVAGENRLLQEALSRMLAKLEDIEITGISLSTPFQPQILLESPPRYFTVVFQWKHCGRSVADSKGSGDRA